MVTKPLMPHRFETFTDQVLILNGHDYEACVFDGCVLQLWRAKSGQPWASARLHNNHIKGCQYVGDGWPKRGQPGFLPGMPED